MRSFISPVAIVALVAVAAPAATPAAPSRDLLVKAAFLTHDKSQALAMVNTAIQQTQAVLDKAPSDHEARLQHSIALGYRGQLTRSPGDAKTARDAMQALVNANPRDPEALVALGGWNLTVVADVGGFIGRTLLGASKDAGYKYLDQAVALGGNRAFYPAYAGLIRLRVNPSDTRTALPLLEKAVAAPAPTSVDRVTQASAGRVAALIKAGNNDGAAALAKQLVPFGTTA